MFICYTIFNSSIIEINNSNNLLIASRGWYGNIRSWDGINFVILSLFTKDLKKIKQNILDIEPALLSNKDIEFKDSKKIIPHGDKLLEGPEDPRLFYYKNDLYILVNEKWILVNGRMETLRIVYFFKIIYLRIKLEFSFSNSKKLPKGFKKLQKGSIINLEVADNTIIIKNIKFYKTNDNIIIYIF